MEITISEDNIVSFRETKTLKQVTLPDFLENLKNLKPLNTGFLPSGCILYHKGIGNSVYVFEETPQIRILNWSSRHTNSFIPYPISMPFIYWIIKINDNHISSIKGRASKVPVRSMDATLYNMGLPNFYDYGAGEMCRGSTQITIGTDIHSSIRKAMNAIWDTNWNGDLVINLPVDIKNYEDWAMKTLADPLLWTKLDLITIDSKWNTFGGLLESD